MFSWKNTHLRESSRIQVPETPGVYVLVKSENVFGLTTSRNYLYIGKSKSLRRRFNEYTRFKRVHNEFIKQEMLLSNLEFWCTSIEEQQLDFAERSLITSIKPPFNKIMYKEFENE